MNNDMIGDDGVINDAGLDNHFYHHHADNGNDGGIDNQLPVVLPLAQQVLHLLGQNDANHQPSEFIWNPQFDPDRPLSRPCVAPRHSLGSYGEFSISISYDLCYTAVCMIRGPDS